MPCGRSADGARERHIGRVQTREVALFRHRAGAQSAEVMVAPTGFELVFQSRSRYSLGLIAR